MSTEKASEATGLSCFELRRGFKQGIYPALLIGTGGKRPRLRWRLDLLEAAIESEMLRRENEEVEAVEACFKEQRRKAGR